VDVADAERGFAERLLGAELHSPEQHVAEPRRRAARARNVMPPGSGGEGEPMPAPTMRELVGDHHLARVGHGDAEQDRQERRRAERLESTPKRATAATQMSAVASSMSGILADTPVPQ
jgi:hypothetical protein